MVLVLVLVEVLVEMEVVVVVVVVVVVERFVNNISWGKGLSPECQQRVTQAKRPSVIEKKCRLLDVQSRGEERGVVVSAGARLLIYYVFIRDFNPSVDLLTQYSHLRSRCLIPNVDLSSPERFTFNF
jgi:hypothetical protein